MTETIAPSIAPPSPARAGEPHVNAALDRIVGEAGWLTPSQFAEVILRAGIVGVRDSIDEGPVGLWVIDRLQAEGIDARAYAGMSTITVYGPRGGRLVVLGQVRIPDGHTMDALEREVTDGEWPELVRGGYDDER
ncbi:hypothetical protein ACOQFV_08970 [Nocardiopsis changdeensis]|uniref:Uncharacterized protein n=1 Tax=Nocardiopsis changdeensis TaxID=2831969 RepID=A0ABX8BDK8_9ACTN|nr:MULTISPECIES: hypothetical protein [Nocardiopsis]QUX20326.1 hypothetical protein KGD84_17510 [Nocardiopsis changdeensis]QYX36256.1 hypothetical protein K1J57_26965 [Nocardiopsis sp. MT53]